MSHNYDFIRPGNCQKQILRTKLGRSEYFFGTFLKFAYSGGILNYKVLSFKVVITAEINDLLIPVDFIIQDDFSNNIINSIIRCAMDYDSDYSDHLSDEP